MMIEVNAYLIMTRAHEIVQRDYQLLRISRESGSVSISYSTSTFGPVLH